MQYARAFFRKIAVWNCCSNMMVDASWLICSTLWVEMQKCTTGRLLNWFYCN
jgi:hypothetical protein